MLTSATPIGARLSLPAKITSSVLRARSVRLACSPSTQRRESATFVLPVPFGPTTQVTPGENCSCVLLAKLLKPWTSSRLRYTRSLRIRLHYCGFLVFEKRVLRGLLLRHLLAAPLADPERAPADHRLHREPARVVR